MKTFDTVEQSIKKVLNNYLTRILGEGSSKVWTKELKIELGRLGEEQGCKICTSGLKDVGYSPEWLYDMVWYKEVNHDGEDYFTEMPLVIECEWDKDFKEIKSDFEKLLVVNAEHKLMICNAYAESVEKTLNFFREAISRYSHNKQGERYMIAILTTDKNTYFQYQVILK
jgi:hypothetical protein